MRHPFLFRALRVSVGKLAVITSLKLRIVREEPVQRTLTTLPPSRLVALLREAQDEYSDKKTLPAWMNETEFFWIPQRHKVAEKLSSNTRFVS